MIEETNDGEDEFDSKDSKFINNIEIILDMIEVVNVIPSPKIIMRSLGI